MTHLLEEVHPLNQEWVQALQESKNKGLNENESCPVIHEVLKMYAISKMKSSEYKQNKNFLFYLRNMTGLYTSDCEGKV